MTYDTIREAAEAWVGEMNAVPRSVAEKLQRVSEYTDIIRLGCKPDEDEFELPMWSTMWAMDDICDKEWIEQNLDTIQQIGFWVFESEDYGYLLGIDGAGYSFYEAHWIPLYKARGLHWHKE